MKVFMRKMLDISYKDIRNMMYPKNYVYVLILFLIPLLLVFTFMDTTLFPVIKGRIQLFLGIIFGLFLIWGLSEPFLFSEKKNKTFSTILATHVNVKYIVMSKCICMTLIYWILNVFLLIVSSVLLSVMGIYNLNFSSLFFCIFTIPSVIFFCFTTVFPIYFLTGTAALTIAIPCLTGIVLMIGLIIYPQIVMLHFSLLIFFTALLLSFIIIFLTSKISKEHIVEVLK